jgi:hypothetical protein
MQVRRLERLGLQELVLALTRQELLSGIMVYSTAIMVLLALIRIKRSCNIV